MGAVANASPTRSVEDLVLTNRDAIDRIVARGEGRELQALLNAAEEDLRKKLERANRAGLTTRWTGAQIQASRAVVREGIRRIQRGLAGYLADATDEVAERSMRGTLRVLKAAERRFTGIVPELALDDAMRFEHALRGARSTVMRSYATSVDRYGTRMIGDFERQMQLGILTGDTTAQMIDRLVGHGGPRGRVSLAATVLPDGTVKRLREEEGGEGLFERRRYWAQRIVRTEMMYSANIASQEAIAEEAAVDFPDLKQLLLEHFDRVTGWDSFAAHGQIRAVGEMFEDGAGRRYACPPGRPNDRAVLIPWRETWGAPKGTMAPKPPRVVEKAEADAGQTPEEIAARAEVKAHAPPPAPLPPPPKQFKEGVHVGKIDAPIQKHRNLVDQVLEATLDQGTLGFLEKHPLSYIKAKNSLGRGVGGLYSASSQWIGLATSSSGRTIGAPFEPGKSWIVSVAAKTPFDSHVRDFTHELGHHIHLGGAPAPIIDDIVEQGFRKGTPISLYARTNAKEYFAESYTAYRHEPAALKAHDPEGFAMVERVLRRRGIL